MEKSTHEYKCGQIVTAQLGNPDDWGYTKELNEQVQCKIIATQTNGATGDTRYLLQVVGRDVLYVAEDPLVHHQKEFHADFYSTMGMKFGPDDSFCKLLDDAAYHLRFNMFAPELEFQIGEEVTVQIGEPTDIGYSEADDAEVKCTVLDVVYPESSGTNLYLLKPNGSNILCSAVVMPEHYTNRFRSQLYAHRIATYIEGDAVNTIEKAKTALGFQA